MPTSPDLTGNATAPRVAPLQSDSVIKRFASKVAKLCPRFSRWFYSPLREAQIAQMHLRNLESILDGKKEFSASVVEKAESWADQSTKKIAFAFFASSKKAIKQMQEKRARLRLRLIDLQIQNRKETLNNDEKWKTVQPNCESWFKKNYHGQTTDDLSKREIDKLKSMVSDMDANSPSRKILEDEIEKYESCKESMGSLSWKSALSEQREKIETVKERCLEDLRKYPELQRGLRKDKALRNRFVRHVVRWQIPVEIFIRFSRDLEKLESKRNLLKNIQLSGNPLRINPVLDRLEVMVDGKMRPISEIPSIEDPEFKNLFDWNNLGMDKDKNGFNLSLAEKNLENAKGVTPSPAKGLIRWNPRTWSKQNENGKWESISLEGDKWWKQLPPYRIREVNKRENEDKGWRLVPQVSHSSRDPQFAGTHSFFSLYIPLEDQSTAKKGRVKVAEYPFGAFAYPFELGPSMFRSLKTELFCFDASLSTEGRGITGYEHKITESDGKKILERIKRERLEALEDGRTENRKSFRVVDSNCSTLTHDICRIARLSIPTQTPILAWGDSRLKRWALKPFAKFPKLLKGLLRLLGTSGVDALEKGSLPAPYLQRKFLQMRSERLRMEQAKESSKQERRKEGASMSGLLVQAWN